MLKPFLLDLRHYVFYRKNVADFFPARPGEFWLFPDINRDFRKILQYVLLKVKWYQTDGRTNRRVVRAYEDVGYV